MGGPQSRRASALPATRAKLKIEGEMLSWVDLVEEMVEGETARSFWIFFPGQMIPLTGGAGVSLEK